MLLAKDVFYVIITIAEPIGCTQDKAKNPIYDMDILHKKKKKRFEYILNIVSFIFKFYFLENNTT